MQSVTTIRRVLALLSLLALFAPAVDFADDAAASRERQIKAAFLYNFTKFVEWPPGSFSGPRDPIVIGVLGQSATAAVWTASLEEIVARRLVNGRVFDVRRVATATEASAVHVLFVAASEVPRFDEIKAALRSSPVLTVGESPAFVSAGGEISFILEGDKVRFVIDAAPAERAGLHISAQLRKLAKPAGTDISPPHTLESTHATLP